jgi:hypothetical protein
MEIETLLKLWAKNIGRVQENGIRQATGRKSFGIEYRIMLEGGAAQLSSSGYQDDLVSDIDVVWTRIHRVHPQHMTAVKEYFKRESYRAVRLALGCSQHSSVRIVHEGIDMLRGAFAALDVSV